MIRKEELNIHDDYIADVDELNLESKPKKFSIDEIEKISSTKIFDLSKAEYEKILEKMNDLDDKNNHKNIKFNQAFQKSNRAYASLEEAKQKDFIIPIIDGTFQKVRGTLLDNQLFAHNGGKFTKWNVSDVASGLSIKSFFASLADCKKFVEEMPEQLKAKIEEKRQTPEYKEMVDKIASLNIDEVKYKDITEDAKLSMSEAFDALDEEEEQISLFDL